MPLARKTSASPEPQPSMGGGVHHAQRHNNQQLTERSSDHHHLLHQLPPKSPSPENRPNQDEEEEEEMPLRYTSEPHFNNNRSYTFAASAFPPVRTSPAQSPMPLDSDVSMFSETAMLKAKVMKRRPGSLHMNRVNFRHDERVFPPDDMPDKALEAKKDVIASVQTDHLGITRPKWNASTITGARFPDPCMKRQLSEFSSMAPYHNFRAEVLQKEPPRRLPKGNKFSFDQRVFMDPSTRDQVLSTHSTRRTEIPIHPKLTTAPEWNPTTSKDSRLERSLLEETRMKSIQNSEKTKRKLKNYIPPTKQVSLLTKEQRARKKQELERTQMMLGSTAALDQSFAS